MFSQVLNFIIGIIVIKMVSAEDFGSFSVATNFINLYVIILGGFLTNALRRFTAYYRGNNDYEKLSGLLKTSLYYAFILSLILTLPFLFFSKQISLFFLKSEVYTKFLFFYSFSIPFIIFSSYLSAYLSGFEKFKELSISNNIMPNIFRLIFLIIWWIFLPFKEIGITLSLVIRSIINFIFNVFYSKENLRVLEHKPRYEFKNWFKFSFPSFIKYGFSYLADNIGVVILGSLKDNLSAGIYRGSSFISSILWNLNIAFSSVLMPRITFLISENKEIIALKTLRKFFLLNTIVIFISLIFLIFFGKFILSLLGKDYVFGYDVLIILTFQCLIGTFSSPFEVYLEAKGRTDLNLLNYIIYSLSSIFFLFFLTKLYSKEGTALAYLFSITLMSISRIIIFKLVSKKNIYNFFDYIIFFFMILVGFGIYFALSQK